MIKNSAQQKSVEVPAPVAASVPETPAGVEVEPPEKTAPVEKKVSTHSRPKPSKVSTHLSKEVSTHSAKDLPAQVYDLADYTGKVSTHFSGFDRKIWKRSRERPGFLIRRIKGYDISEDKYGVSYLFVTGRQPKKRTSADFASHEHAGFFNWQALEKIGRLVKEIKNERKRIGNDRSRSS